MINLRSPYFVIYTDTNLTSIDLDLYIHTGTRSLTVTGAQYSLSSTAYDEEVVVDISELCRDYIDTTFNGSYSCTAVWVNYQITPYISSVAQTPLSVVRLTGFDGYQYFEDGPQSSSETYTAPDLLQSNTVIYKHSDGVVRVPVLQDNITDVHFLHKGKVTNTVAITPSSASTSIIRYPSNTGASSDTFKARVEADSGTYEAEACGNFSAGWQIRPCDKIILETASSATTIDVVDIDECRYEPIKVTFVNKYGALQDVWFFKKHIESTSVDSESYRKTIISSGTYSTSRHQMNSLRRNAKERLSLNTGIYPEEYNEVFKQLTLSEFVWIEYNGNTLPVTVTSGDLQYKTSVNDKITQYTMEVEFSHNKINDIR